MNNEPPGLFLSKCSVCGKSYDMRKEISFLCCKDTGDEECQDFPYCEKCYRDHVKKYHPNCTEKDFENAKKEYERQLFISNRLTLLNNTIQDIKTN